jgi:hypothetical protein
MLVMKYVEPAMRKSRKLNVGADIDSPMPSPRMIALIALAPLISIPAAQAANIFTPGDFIIAIDGNRNLPGNTNTGAEGPLSAFDGSDTTKWLSFGRTFTGLIATPSGGASTVQSLSFTTGGDAPERDPVTYLLFGTNDVITSVDNSTGLAENWTLISGGSTGLGLSTQPALNRNTTGSLLSFSNSTSYSSYKFVFTQLRSANANAFDPVTLANGANPNSIQLSEVRLYDQSSANVFSATPSLAVGIDQTDSFYPFNERPLEAIDGSKAAGSKHLNFGREGSGLIITPSIGASVARSFQITTANDTEGRDPSLYEIYGTNSSIFSLENSLGESEPWTLITSGSLTLPAGRNVDGDLIGFSNETPYLSYKILFPENKGPDTGANSVQFSEVQFFDTVPEPSTAALMLFGVTSLGLSRKRRHS